MIHGDSRWSTVEIRLPPHPAMASETPLSLCSTRGDWSGEPRGNRGEMFVPYGKSQQTTRVVGGTRAAHTMRTACALRTARATFASHVGHARRARARCAGESRMHVACERICGRTRVQQNYIKTKARKKAITQPSQNHNKNLHKTRKA